MDENPQDDERVRLLNEMRAYGKATPFAHGAEPATKRANVYDSAMGEWFRSKTFKLMLLVTCLVPIFAVCMFLLLITGSITLGGYVILADIQRALGLGGY